MRRHRRAKVTRLEPRLRAREQHIKPGQVLGYFTHHGRAIQLKQNASTGPRVSAVLLPTELVLDSYEAYEQYLYTDIGLIIVKRCVTPYMQYIDPTGRTPGGAAVVEGFDGFLGIELVGRAFSLAQYAQRGEEPDDWTNGVINRHLTYVDEYGREVT